MDYRFRPELHPRNRLGRFIEVLGSLRPGDTVRLPDGVKVERRVGGTYRLTKRGGRRPVDTRSVDYAAKAGLTGLKEMSPEAKTKMTDRVRDSLLSTVEIPRKGPATPGYESMIRVRPAMSPGTKPPVREYRQDASVPLSQYSPDFLEPGQRSENDMTQDEIFAEIRSILGPRPASASSASPMMHRFWHLVSLPKKPGQNPGLVGNMWTPLQAARQARREFDGVPPGSRAERQLMDKLNIRIPSPQSPGTEPSGMDFGMFTKKGNDEIAALIDERTKNGPLDAVGYGILQDEMEYVGTGEAGDTMVRDEVFSYLIDNGLLTPEAVKEYATDSFRDQALDRLAKATPSSPQSPGVMMWGDGPGDNAKFFYLTDKIKEIERKIADGTASDYDRERLPQLKADLDKIPDSPQSPGTGGGVEDALAQMRAAGTARSQGRPFAGGSPFVIIGKDEDSGAWRQMGFADNEVEAERERNMIASGFPEAEPLVVPNELAGPPRKVDILEDEYHRLAKEKYRADHDLIVARGKMQTEQGKLREMRSALLDKQEGTEDEFVRVVDGEVLGRGRYYNNTQDEVAAMIADQEPIAKAAWHDHKAALAKAREASKAASDADEAYYNAENESEFGEAPSPQSPGTPVVPPGENSVTITPGEKTGISGFNLSKSELDSMPLGSQAVIGDEVWTKKLSDVGGADLGPALPANAWENEKGERLFAADLAKRSVAPPQSPGTPDFDDSYVIQDQPSGPYIVGKPGGKLLGEFSDFDEAIAAINADKEKDQYWPDTYYVNERGAVDLLDNEGNMISPPESPGLEDVADAILDGTPMPKPDAGDIKDKPLYELADEIRRDWKNVNFGAKPYLDALDSLSSVNDDYGLDPGRSIVAYFLSNARGWKGEKAKEIKAELKRRLSEGAEEPLTGWREILEARGVSDPDKAFD